MSSETTNATTDRKATQTESSAETPTVTVIATGPATFTRRADTGDDVATIQATHQTVALQIERQIQSADTFETLLEPMFRGSGPTVCPPVVIDTLLEKHARDGYKRAGDTDDWELTITGTATAWKRLALQLVPDLTRGRTTQAAAVHRLADLVQDEITNDGAILAALDLIDQHGIEDIRTERFTTHLSDMGDTDE